MVTTNQIHVDHWGTYITTPKVSEESATVKLEVKIKNNQNTAQQLKVKTELYDQNNQVVAQDEKVASCKDSLCTLVYDFNVNQPELCQLIILICILQ